MLANRLKTTFDAVVLTSYGMTECMPISSPTQAYRLDPTGTSGQAVGPQIIITDEDHTAKLPAGQVRALPLKSTQFADIPCRWATFL